MYTLSDKVFVAFMQYTRFGLSTDIPRYFSTLVSGEGELGALRRAMVSMQKSQEQLLAQHNKEMAELQAQQRELLALVRTLATTSK